MGRAWHAGGRNAGSGKTIPAFLKEEAGLIMQTEIAHMEAITLWRLETKSGVVDHGTEFVEGPKTRWEKENSGQEDPQLIQALREGREEAFTALITRYHSTLIRLAKAFVPSQAIAEEVVQETWMGVLKGIGRFEGRSSFKTWICRILTNRAKTRGRQERRYIPFLDMAYTSRESEASPLEWERVFPLNSLAEFRPVAATNWDEKTPERLLLSKESLKQVERAIRSLPPTQQQVIILRDVERISSEEACTLLGVSMTNQRVLLHRARAKVRQAMERYLEGQLSHEAAI